MKDFRAESCGRNTDAEFARFLQIAMGSASENKLLLPHDLGSTNKEQYDLLNTDVTEINRLLASLLKTLRANR